MSNTLVSESLMQSFVIDGGHPLGGRVRAAGNKDLEFCKACFEGVYPTGDITERMLADIEQDRLAASNS